jgi:hypothetical protein
MGELVRTPLNEITNTLEVLDNLRVSPAWFTRLRTDEDFAKRVRDFMSQGAISESSSQLSARSVMGDYYFGPREWDSLTRYHLLNSQLSEAEQFPWTPEQLKAPCPFTSGFLVKETHVAFYAPQFLFPNKHEVSQNFWSENVYSNVVYSNPGSERPNEWRTQAFAAKSCPARWNLLFVGGVPGSHSRPYEEQCKLLPSGYEVPTTIEFTIGMHAWQKAIESEIKRSGEYHPDDWGQRWSNLHSTYHQLHLSGRVDVDQNEYHLMWEYTTTLGPTGYIRYSRNIPQAYLGLAAIRRGPVSQ